MLAEAMSQGERPMLRAFPSAVIWTSHSPTVDLQMIRDQQP